MHESKSFIGENTKALAHSCISVLSRFNGRLVGISGGWLVHLPFFVLFCQSQLICVYEYDQHNNTGLLLTDNKPTASWLWIHVALHIPALDLFCGLWCSGLTLWRDPISSSSGHAVPDFFYTFSPDPNSWCSALIGIMSSFHFWLNGWLTGATGACASRLALFPSFGQFSCSSHIDLNYYRESGVCTRPHNGH